MPTGAANMEVLPSHVADTRLKLQFGHQSKAFNESFDIKHTQKFDPAKQDVNQRAQIAYQKTFFLNNLHVDGLLTWVPVKISLK